MTSCEQKKSRTLVCDQVSDKLQRLVCDQVGDLFRTRSLTSCEQKKSETCLQLVTDLLKTCSETWFHIFVTFLSATCHRLACSGPQNLVLK